ncbi:D-alanyl-D-alanine carboxypeptidase family protein [Virgibacillus halophilus]|uniref:D-alanyl-D-alanine carboxypeptidase family protein n=1 Tax=Tigheibacillus halophilus TaxID=361280 RepID=UPI0036425E47
MRTRLLITGILIALITCVALPVDGRAEMTVSARNAILMDQKTGNILFEKDADEKRPIASITKIMTAIVAIESGMLEEQATASRKAVYTEGSSIYLEQGEKMTIKDLVYGLMLRSGNDAAVAISEHIGGSEEGFVYLMNEKARWLGMTNTHFKNPHGLHEKGHYSTAHDMAILMRYAMSNKLFRAVTAAKVYKAENRSYAWGNKNKLLTKYYDACVGGKTGYTKVAGRTLVSAAEKEGVKLIAVTLQASDDWNDHMAMYEKGFKEQQAAKRKSPTVFSHTGKLSTQELFTKAFQHLIGLNGLW